MKTDKEVLCKAMENARETFKETIEEENLDPSFFDLELTGFLLSQNHAPLEVAKFLPRHEAENYFEEEV